MGDRSKNTEEVQPSGDGYLLKTEADRRQEAVERAQTENREWRARELNYQASQVGLNRRVVVLTTVLVVLGLIGSGLTTWQSYEAARSAAAAKVSADEAAIANKQSLDATRLERRAWLGVPNVSLKFEVDRILLVGLRVQNSGATPGKQVSTLMKMEVRDAGDKCTPHFADPKDLIQSSSAVFAGAGVTIPMRFRPLTVEEFAQLGVQRPRTHLCINAQIRYLDVFDQPHETEFCGFVVIDEKTDTVHVATLEQTCNRVT